MGYRSDRKTLITLEPNGTTAEKELEPLMKNKAFLEGIQEGEVLIEHEEGYDKITLTFNDVKWYDDYGFVDAVEEWERKMEEKFDNGTLTGGLHMIRLGESMEDAEENWVGDPHEELYFNRRVEYENDPTEKAIDICKLVKEQNKKNKK